MLDEVFDGLGVAFHGGIHQGGEAIEVLGIDIAGEGEQTVDFFRVAMIGGGHQLGLGAFGVVGVGGHCQLLFFTGGVDGGGGGTYREGALVLFFAPEAIEFVLGFGSVTILMGKVAS